MSPSAQRLGDPYSGMRPQSQHGGTTADGDDPHRWVAIDGVVVSFTTPGPISDEVWRGFLEFVAQSRPRYCMVLCAGAINLDVAQRRRLTHAVMRAHASVIVLTDDRVTGRIAKAVAWFGAKLDTYAWSELSVVLASLEVTEGTRRRLHDAARGFHEQHGHLDSDSRSA